MDQRHEPGSQKALLRAQSSFERATPSSFFIATGKEDFRIHIPIDVAGEYKDLKKIPFSKNDDSGIKPGMIPHNVIYLK